MASSSSSRLLTPQSTSRRRSHPDNRGPNANSSAAKKPRPIPSILLFIVGFGCLLLWQGTRQDYYHPGSSSSYSHLDLPNLLYGIGGEEGYPNGPLGVPPGEAPALQSKKRASHLGGFANDIDVQGISPHVWKKMIQEYNIKSVIDLGCGRAITTSWFLTHGLQARGIDGSPESFRLSAVPKELHSKVLVEHDYALGPWWPAETYDALWSVEFIEHVGMNFMQNYLPTMRKAALIFMTTSRWGGHHHVEVHSDDWWIRKYEAFGFRYSDSLTNQVRGWATQEANRKVKTFFAPDKEYKAQHIWLTMKVFVNPVVAALPAHHHLFYEPGCFERRDQGVNILRECGQSETKLPDSYLPLKLTPEQDKAWEKMVLKALKLPVGPGTAVEATESTSDEPADSEKIKPSDLAPQELPEVLQRIRDRNFTNMPIVPVVAWPYVKTGVTSAEHKHVEENGIMESQVLRMSKDINDLDPNVVWVADVGTGEKWKKWCDTFYKVVERTMKFRISKGAPPRWPICFVDWTDYPSLQRCENIEELMGREYVKYNTRSVGAGRRWHSDVKWLSFGNRLNTTMEDGLTYQQVPLVARTDTVKSIQTILAKRGFDLTYPVETLPRSTDVIHLWPTNDTKKVNQQYANLRVRVSEIVNEIGNDPSLNVTSFVGLAGKPLKEGRRGVQDAYTELLLDTKIVVLAQRDLWEDHYRLMEGLVSGACVITDFMHGLPHGLENATSVLEYKTPIELRSLILYYLKHDEERIEIGRRGREVAMQKHRTWHRIEEVIFGESLTTCELKGPGSCPYIVHGDEKR